jgi:tetratricopeptide (TPR) repeat protein
MGNWLARIKTPATAGLAVLLCVAAAASFAPLASAAEKEKKPAAISEEVVKKLKPAQDACTKGDYDTCISLAREALAISTKTVDKEQSLRFLTWGLGKKGDFPAYADAVEQLNALDTVPADDKTKSYPNLARIFYQQKNFEKSEKYSRLWAEGDKSSEAYGLLVAIYYTQQNCPDTITAQEKAIAIDKAAGKETAEQALKILNSCYYKTNDKPRREAVLEELLRRFPKADYFSDLLQVYEELNLDKRAKLNLYRYALDKDYISRESVFVDYADEALNVGAPAEALKVIETATAKGAFKIIAATDRNGKLSTAAKQQAADDRKTIVQLDKEARAGKNGEADVKTGLAYLGLGEYDKAVEAIERGLTPERVGKVKRVDDAQMMLGIAYKKLGKTAEATKAFTTAKEDPRMAKAATIWLQSL